MPGKREMCSHESERERRSILFEREKAEVEICMKRDLGSDISSLEFHALARGRGRGHFARDVICRRVAQLLSLLTHRETMLACDASTFTSE